MITTNATWSTRHAETARKITKSRHPAPQCLTPIQRPAPLDLRHRSFTCWATGRADAGAPLPLASVLLAGDNRLW